MHASEHVIRDKRHLEKLSRSLDWLRSPGGDLCRKELGLFLESEGVAIRGQSRWKGILPRWR